MNEQEIAATKEWIERWAEIGPVIEKMGIAHDANAPLAKVLPQFNGALRHALKKHPPKPYSGLVEQQRLFRRFRP